MKKIYLITAVGMIVCMLITGTVIPALRIINNEKTIKKPLDDPIWEWAESGGGFSVDYGHDVAVDNSGNVYIIGKYHAIGAFGNTTLTSYGPIDSWDIFVAKLDADGNWLWAVGAGGKFSDEGLGIDVDNDGNIYITGVFYDVAYFGNTTLIAIEDLDVYVAKIDTNGNWLWALRAGGNVGEAGYGIKVDSNGNSYVTGHFMWSATFGDITVTSAGSADVFVAKLDTDGNWLWAVSGGGSLPDFVCEIALDSNGNAYLTGDFEGSATFGTSTITSQGNVDVFIVKLDADGNWLWAKSGGGISIERGYDISVDINGNAYVTGVFLGTVMFGTTTLTSQGSWDVYVLKIDTNGDWQWAVRGGSSSSDGAWSIAVMSSGIPYISGVFDGSATFGSTTIYSQGGRDVFAAKLDTNGNWLWAIGAGGADWDEGYAIYVDEHGTSYVTGYFDGTATFGTSTLVTEGNYDVFIAKLSDGFENQPPSTPIIEGMTSGNAGEEYSYSFSTEDIENDDVYYYVDWDDGTYEEWIGPYTSGETLVLNHTWDEQGTYEIKVKAKDIFNAESDWGYLEVTMPVNQVDESMTFLQKIFTRFPNAFPILRYILGLS